MDEKSLVKELSFGAGQFKNRENRENRGQVPVFPVLLVLFSGFR
jgi:hypothetical protein